MRNTKPTIAPAVRPLAGPRATPTTITAAIVRTENTSPDGNRNAPMTWALICDCWRSSTTLAGRGPEHLAGVVGPHRREPVTTSVTADEHLAVALARLLVRLDEMPLDHPQDERSGAATTNATRARIQL